MVKSKTQYFMVTNDKHGDQYLGQYQTNISDEFFCKKS